MGEKNYITLKSLFWSNCFINIEVIPDIGEEVNERPTHADWLGTVCAEEYSEIRGLQNYTSVNLSWVHFFLKDDKYTHSTNIQVSGFFFT